ncbi:methylenetetrahydrofolate reductase [NAD(P)H] [Chitinimonas sp. BJB300]|uniref:methylenetetrahydrofolate reductase [NAD(P)H] n=1 Tax=Chitinimonas sp. BJB300 TaxID=1559339 RepID=UPI000C0D91BF|nr:methylenetetrahydrofolate reductase [NAD(P)H] [Chitinimonas sp. BJB300]PHV10249.1 methylenetetrahydrofolate reductase [NAD(P)H] [Chitinimonas sp. BJB300]TSJ91106.1 methylenetetrahydrofolate reductase [NAD(P)H] [Chitinimonas sp. BJB300]
MSLSPTFSFEFFPPKTAEGIEKLRNTRRQLAQFKPAFFSVTFGAGGTTQEGTLATVLEIKSEGFEAAPHLSCVGSTRENVAGLLRTYRDHGIRRIVALRGDIPSGMVEFGEFRYANELVEFIRTEHGDWFHIEVAAYPEYHPQARSAHDDIANFIRKARAGANSAMTQYFFNPDAYFAFVDEVSARGVDIPIVPGIMPINNFSQLARFSDACGAEIPRWLRLKLQSYGDDTASIKALGLDVITDLCRKLLDGGAPGLHFYTLNAAGNVSTIWQRLGLADIRNYSPGN